METFMQASIRFSAGKDNPWLDGIIRELRIIGFTVTHKDNLKVVNLLTNREPESTDYDSLVESLTDCTVYWWGSPFESVHDNDVFGKIVYDPSSNDPIARYFDHEIDRYAKSV